jgi:aspartate/methionine/tyrosine aminotransferase
VTSCSSASPAPATLPRRPMAVSAFDQNSEAFALHLLKQCNVAVTPGTAFGTYGEGFVRFSLATTEEKLSLGLDRLLQA